MSKGKRLKEYDEYYYNNSADGQPVVLAKRGGSWVKKLIISLTVTIAVLALLIGGGLLIGNYFCQNNLGVSLWTVFEVAGDIRYDKDADQVVTNAYNGDVSDISSDYNGFYSVLNKNMFLSPDVGTKTIISNFVSSIMSGEDISSDELSDDILGLFTKDSLDIENIENYDGWKTGEQHDPLSYLTGFTDKQFAAFLNEIVISSLDTMIDLPYDISLSGKNGGKPLVNVDQMIIQRGADMSDGEKAFIRPIDTNVYMTLTASIGLHEIAMQVTDGMGVSGFDWLVKWLLPKQTYLTITFDMNDASATPVYELNRLGRYSCNYKGVGDGESVEMNKMDRLMTVIDTIMENVNGEPVSDILDDTLMGITPYIAKSDDSAFSFGNMILFDSVQKSSTGGNYFKMNFLETVMDSISGSINLTTPDIIVLMQTVLVSSENTQIVLDNAPGADVYKAASQETGGGDKQRAAAFADLSNTDYDDIGEEELNNMIDVYGLELLKQVAEAYDIGTTNKDGEEYTVEDLYGALGLGEPTEYSSDLQQEIQTGVESKEAEHEADPENVPMPEININDEMLCAIVYMQLDELEGTLDTYGIKMQKLAIEKEMINEVEHSFVRIYCKFSFDSLVGESGEMMEMVTGLLGGESMLLEVIADITLTEGVEKEPSKILINGLYGEDEGLVEYEGMKKLNGLSTDYVLNILQKVSSFDTETILSELSGNINAALAEVQQGTGDSRLLVGLNFEESKPANVA